MFEGLPVPTEEQLQGRFRALIVGPLWLRMGVRPSLALAGLRGFWGKELCGFGAAKNLVSTRDGVRASFPMELGVLASRFDGRPCAVLSYGPGSPFPWRHVRDELRALGEGHLLGMMLVDTPLLRRLAIPFLLVRTAA